MKSRIARGLVLACTAAGAGLSLLIFGAGSAVAAGASTQCSGANITGQGASVMKVAYQSVFGPDFNTSSNPFACDGSQGTAGKPEVKYTSSSSGTGLESWGVGGKPGSYGVGNAFVVTEEPPNPTDKTEIENNETPGGPKESLLTIPVAQEAIAVLIHLPASCTATSTSFPGRLVLTNEVLQKIFLGTITTWNQIEGGGDVLSGSGCTSSITRVVRLDSAGSTHILKKYLNLINNTPFATEAGSKSWDEVSEGTLNTQWPTAAAVTRPSKTGDTAEVSKVAETAGSIGYASLANARANEAFIPPHGGKEQATFWAPIQNDGTAIKKKVTFADPSTDADTSAPADANCAKEKYTNGKGSKFPPKSVQATWQEVTTETKQKNYPICGIAYQLAFTQYSQYPGTTAEEELTVSNFLDFVLATKTGGGQLLIENHDYEALPKALDKEAVKGVALISFL